MEPLGQLLGALVGGGIGIAGAISSTAFLEWVKGKKEYRLERGRRLEDIYRLGLTLDEWFITQRQDMLKVLHGIEGGRSESLRGDHAVQGMVMACRFWHPRLVAKAEELAGIVDMFKSAMFDYYSVLSETQRKPSEAVFEAAMAPSAEGQKRLGQFLATVAAEAKLLQHG